MRSCEILKDIKKAYDLLNSSDFLTNFYSTKQLENTSDVFKKLYEETYLLFYNNPEKRKQLLSSCGCPGCNKRLYISDLVNYSYVCKSCDENFYNFETNDNSLKEYISEMEL